MDGIVVAVDSLIGQGLAGISGYRSTGTGREADVGAIANVAVECEVTSTYRQVLTEGQISGKVNSMVVTINVNR